MTVSYTAQVASCKKFGCFWKLLFRWKGSIYKLLWPNLTVFTVLYFSLSVVYRFILDEKSKLIFEQVSLHCHTYGDLIPLSFVLGFYVALVIKRWWDQYACIPWPDTMAVFVSAFVTGQDDRGRLMRRTIMRYANLSFLLTLRMVCPSVKKRFPTNEHVIEAGFMNENESLIMERMSKKTSHSLYWMPLVWATAVLTRARREGRVKDDFALKTLVDEVSKFRSGCGGLLNFDWISVPLVYTQVGIQVVVTLAVYTYFLGTLMGNQYLDVKKGYPQHTIDLVVPIFTLLQFFFYMGWLLVAETLVNPFGEDDDDFEVNWLIDRDLQVSYLIVDEMHEEHPHLIKDQYWDEVFPTELPYTEATKQFHTEQFLGSTRKIEVPPSLTGFVTMSVKNHRARASNPMVIKSHLVGTGAPITSMNCLTEGSSSVMNFMRKHFLGDNKRSDEVSSVSVGSRKFKNISSSLSMSQLTSACKSEDFSDQLFKMSGLSVAASQQSRCLKDNFEFPRNDIIQNSKFKTEVEAIPFFEPSLDIIPVKSREPIRISVFQEKFQQNPGFFIDDEVEHDQLNTSLIFDSKSEVEAPEKTSSALINIASKLSVKTKREGVIEKDAKNTNSEEGKTLLSNYDETVMLPILTNSQPTIETKEESFVAITESKSTLAESKSTLAIDIPGVAKWSNEESSSPKVISKEKQGFFDRVMSGTYSFLVEKFVPEQNTIATEEDPIEKIEEECKVISEVYIDVNKDEEVNQEVTDLSCEAEANLESRSKEEKVVRFASQDEVHSISSDGGCSSDKVTMIEDSLIVEEKPLGTYESEFKKKIHDNIPLIKFSSTPAIPIPGISPGRQDDEDISENSLTKYKFHILDTIMETNESPIEKSEINVTSLINHGHSDSATSVEDGCVDKDKVLQNSLRRNQTYALNNISGINVPISPNHIKLNNGSVNPEEISEDNTGALNNSKLPDNYGGSSGNPNNHSNEEIKVNICEAESTSESNESRNDK